MNIVVVDGYTLNPGDLSWRKLEAMGTLTVSRGPLIDEAALARALREGRIAGAGLDVLSVEPPLPGHPLLGAPNCMITPHIAWATFEARSRLMDTAIENVASFLAGSPKNLITIE